MKIKVIGEKFSIRSKLLKNINKAMNLINENYNVILIDSKKEENKDGVSNTPALVIKEKIINQWKVLIDTEISNYIKVLS